MLAMGTEIAMLVANSLNHFDSIRYRLHAWCIMPNHVHVIVQPLPNYDLSTIIHSWKSFTAHKANKILGIDSAFWQKDAYNRIIRSRKEYNFHIQYTWNNPEKAGLQNWQWRWKLDSDVDSNVLGEKEPDRDGLVTLTGSIRGGRAN